VTQALIEISAPLAKTVNEVDVQNAFALSVIYQGKQVQKIKASSAKIKGLSLVVNFEKPSLAAIKDLVQMGKEEWTVKLVVQNASKL
jgi:hypothetical protein